MKPTFNTLNALLVGGIMTFQATGCDMPPDEMDETGETDGVAIEARAAAMDGEALFREILFPNAAVAKRVPELARLYQHSGLQDKDDAERQALLAVQDLLISGIEDFDPEFFDKFEMDMTSGDPRRVQAALEESSLLLQESLRGWGARLDMLFEKEGLADLGQVFAEDPELKKLAEMSVVDRAVLKRIAELLREQLTPVVPPNRDVDVVVDLQKLQVLHLNNPVALDYQNTINRVITDTVLQSQVNAQLDQHLTFDRVTQAVALQLDHQLATNHQLALHQQFALQANLPAKAVDLQVARITAADFARWGDVGDVTVEVETAVYAVVAVAVAVVAVVVLVVGQPLDGAAYLNGDKTQLFQDQLVANLTQAYAR